MMKKVYIALFSILYLCIAVISCIHAYEFFGLANAKIMAAVLSGAFEVGQAAVLFALLTSDKERNKIMPWVLMVIFTLVQILGNIYACYKYIMVNSQELLVYFKEPIFIWTNLPDAQATVIVTYIVAAILPICGLLLTSMVTNFLDNGKETKEQKIENEIEEKLEKKKVEKLPILDEKIEPTVEEIPSPVEEIIEDKTEENDLEEEIQENENEIEEDISEQSISDVSDLMSGPIPQTSEGQKQKSHFINI